jgi:hypothetical protein
MDVKQIDAGDLDVGYVDAGPEHGASCSCMAGPTTSTPTTR